MTVLRKLSPVARLSSCPGVLHAPLPYPISVAGPALPLSLDTVLHFIEFDTFFLLGV